MADTNITPSSGAALISPIWFHRYASEFATWARKAHDGMGDNFSPVPYYLCCRSLELVLKAFLLAKGVSQRELMKRDLGHDLCKILLKAKNLDLEKEVPLTSHWEAEVEKANDYYADKGFEYLDVATAGRGYPNLPNLDILNELVSTLLTNLKDVCLYA